MIFMCIAVISTPFMLNVTCHVRINHSRAKSQQIVSLELHSRRRSHVYQVTLTDASVARMAEVGFLGQFHSPQKPARVQQHLTPVLEQVGLSVVETLRTANGPYWRVTATLKATVARVLRPGKANFKRRL
ncbi:hypothetical protein A6X21_07440 [Planctopirus hydrillae]|uniref:Uncharacterized protein n=1 Tax=Planctopirus hydrillae TaxID=1841610 RepID=A0A1C3E8Z1_9PLAN|nr:hypothetical protein A6X21_07440 [Planctopirus hydrillae]